MFTLNLNEIELDPKISEDKKFESESDYDLTGEAVAYIEATYPGVYENPFTLKRKIEAAIKDAEGKVDAERKADRMEVLSAEFDQQIADSREKSERVEAMLREEFGTDTSYKFDGPDAEVDEYLEKLRLAETPEDRARVEEEWKLKTDESNFNRMKQDQKIEDRRRELIDTEGI